LKVNFNHIFAHDFICFISIVALFRFFLNLFVVFINFDDLKIEKSVLVVVEKNQFEKAKHGVFVILINLLLEKAIVFILTLGNLEMLAHICVTRVIVQVLLAEMIDFEHPLVQVGHICLFYL
jgi:hypothetical protein